MAIRELLVTLFGRIRKRLARLRRKNAVSLGQSLVIIALAFLGIIAFVGFVVDTGIIYLHRVWLGQAVDAAALAAGYELPNIKGACARAVEYLQANGYEPGLDFSFQIVYPSLPDAPVPPGDPGEFVIDSIDDAISIPADCGSVAVPGTHDDMHYEVEVFATQQVSTIFMHILGFGEISVTAPSTAERSNRYDVVLVLDHSGSMKFDTCRQIRPGEDYGCENRYRPCVPFYTEDFEAYDKLEDVEAAGWVVNDGVKLMKPAGERVIELRKGDDDPGEIYRTIDTTGFESVALFLTADNINLGTSNGMQLSWRPNDGVGWLEIAEYDADDMPRDPHGYAVMLPSTADNNPNLQVRITSSMVEPKRLRIDDIQLQSCAETPGPWVWNKPDTAQGCYSDEVSLTCETDDPNSLLPGVSISGDRPPMAQLMEQPMLDTLLASEVFIDLLDARRVGGAPREDQIGLVQFGQYITNLHDLTTDYEAIKDLLFSSIYSHQSTNIGGGIRVGLSVLGDGRPNSAHFMILITDGWPNMYDLPYVNPTTFGKYCHPADCPHPLQYIDVQVEAAKNQNVTIFAIGLGEFLEIKTFDASAVYGPGFENCTGMDILNRIASNTGGVAYYAPTTDELEQIFEWIAEAIFVRLTG